MRDWTEGDSEIERARVPVLSTLSLPFPSRAFLLAGGRGERLRPITDRTPKCLVSIAGEPLLAIWLQHCARYGIRQVLLNVSHHGDQVAEFLGSRKWGVEVHLVREATPIGNAGTVREHRDFVEDAASFFILYADNLTDVALDRLVACHIEHEGPLTIGLFRSPTPSAAGIVTMSEEGVVSSFVEKPAHPMGNLANAGIYVARPSLFGEIPTREGVVDFGTHVLPRLVGRMRGCLIEDYLADVGTPGALALATDQWVRRSEGGPRP